MISVKSSEDSLHMELPSFTLNSGSIIDANKNGTEPKVREDSDEDCSLESLDLDAPLAYQVEPVEFPKSPAALRLLAASIMPVEPAVHPLSDEEESDRSIFQAQLLSNCEDVRLVRGELKESRRKVIPAMLEDDDCTSLDESIVDDTSYPSCLTVDQLDDSDSTITKIDLIPEMSALEEALEVMEDRAWKKCTVGGVERRIDLRVLEPYKRVLSHGGYLSHGSRNAILVFSACFLPDRTRIDYDYVMDNLFMYVISTLDHLVTDDYVLVYLHGAASRSVMPKFSWLKECYRMIDRKLRKNLKGLFLVHPTFWLKTLYIMTRPFVSSKFSKKLFFVHSLNELYKKVPVEEASIPEKVVRYDYVKQALSSGS